MTSSEGSRMATIRRLSHADMPFVERMLLVAAHWQTNPDRLNEPVSEETPRYVAGWGRPGDLGVVAIDEQDSPVGAAWYRLFPEEKPGYGFVDSTVPELSIAVRADKRAQGTGTQLLQALIESAAMGEHTMLSLSVSCDNPAVRLYERLGFSIVGQADGSWTMLLSIT